MNKYEQLIEHIINENEQAARELFHNIVVEKSREIYESLMDEDQVDENIDQYDQQADLAGDIQADETHGLGEDDLEGGEIELDGGDDMGDDLGMGDEEFGAEEGEAQDQFQNIKDAIADLEAEFAKLSGDDMGDMGGEEGEGDNQSGTGSDEFGGEEEVGAEEGPEVMEGEQPEWLKKKGSGASGSGKSGSGVSGSGKAGSGKSGSGKAVSEAEMMREYVEKISAPSNTEGADNKGSVVAGKNDMGGTAANIAKGGSEQAPDGTSPKGKAGGFVKSAQEIDVAKRNVNKVGGNKGAQDFYNTKAKGKTGEGQTTDGSVSVNKSSLEGGK